MRRRIRHAQPIHKRFLLHPATIMVLLVAGVLIAGWTYHAVAASYTVNAKVPAPPLAEGAIITSPSDGTTFHSSPITVSGTCPADSYVTIFRSGSPSGTSWCTGNMFSVRVSLVTGSNELQAQDYNITDDPGPATPSITVTYTPPITPPSGPSSPPPSGEPGGGTQSLTLSSAYHYRSYSIGEQIQWNVLLAGGIAPYTVRAVWADGNTTTLTVPGGGKVTLTHAYQKAGFYTFKIYAYDQAGASAVLQLIAAIRATDTIGSLGSIGNGAPTAPNWWENLLNGANKWLWLAWPTYITVTLMAVSFWLGEHQAIGMALQHARQKHRLLHRGH